MPSIDPKTLNERLGKIKGVLPRKGRANTLSVCMIVKNEESNIEAAVRSFLPFADEIIVNDTGSTDNTLSILKRLPVKIIENEWEGDFSIARNQSIAVASCAWILWMDADDRVPTSQVEDFKRLKTAPLDRCIGFQVINTQKGMAIGTRFMQTRMFPNHPKIRFERRVHEQVIYSIAALGLHSFFVETEILHTGYEDPKQKKIKAQRNIDLLMNDPDRGLDPILPMQEGDSYAILGRWEESIESYKFAYNIPDCKNIQRDAWQEIPNCIGRSYMSMNNTLEAEKWFKIALDHNQDRIEPFFYLGELFFKSNRSSEAKKWLYKAVEKERKLTSVSNQYDVMHIYSLNYLCHLLTAEKDFVEGCRIAKIFTEKWPSVVEGWTFLGKMSLSLSQHQEAVFALQKAIEMTGERNESVWQAFFFALERSGASAKTMAEWKKKSPHKTLLSQPTQQNLSVCMIVKNEEGHLENCLQSLGDLEAELIIVDTGSEDRTVEIAKNFGAKVFHFPWESDFAKARNFSFDQSQSKWNLWLDADDILLAADVQRIKRLVQQEPDRAYGLSVKNSTDLGATGSVFQQIRLVPNHPKIRFTGKVHEQLSPALQKFPMAIEMSDIKVIHTGYTDDETVEKKQWRNLEIMLREISESPGEVTAVKLYSIAGCYQDLKNWQEAKAWYKKALQRAQDLGEDPHVAEMCPIKIAQCLGNEDKFYEAIPMVEESLRQHPFNPEARQVMGQLYQAVGETKKALFHYMSLFVFEEKGSVIPFDFQLLKFKAIRFVAEYLAQNRQMELAKLIMKEGLALKEGRPLSREMIFSLCFEYEAYELGVALLEFVISYKAESDDYYNLGRCYIMLNEVKKALNVLQLGMKRFPGNKEIAQMLELLQKDLGIVIPF